MSENLFSKLSDDVVLNILHKLDEDPRHWARISCVCSKFRSLILTVCFPAKCSSSIPAVVSDLNPETWSSLYKLAVCCPGLHHSGVLLEHSDFGLERQLGPDHNYRTASSSSSNSRSRDNEPVAIVSEPSSSDCAWSLYDDLMFDTLYGDPDPEPVIEPEIRPEVENSKPELKRRRIFRSLRSHLASGIWDLSREQGNKLLASRFKGDCLYICDWPGCLHVEERRNYMLFRGVFRNFKQSRVWRTINEGGSGRSRIDLSCAYCASNETWDLHSSFCLRRYFGFHDDGEPVVRAYVCENGHVSGAWTDWPLYT